MSVAPFVPVSGDMTEMTIGQAFAATTEEWSDLQLVTYNDNVTSQKEFYYLPQAVIDDDPETFEGCEAGWYLIDEYGDPDLEAGCQNAEVLPYGQGCVLNGWIDGLGSTSAGEVLSKNVEIEIPNGARRMTGNALPRTIDINEIKSGTDEWSDIQLVTYDDNVTSQQEFYYLPQAVIDDDPETFDGFEAGWYFIDEYGDPDLEAGRQMLPVPAGQGFVINAWVEGATYIIPKPL